MAVIFILAIIALPLVATFVFIAEMVAGIAPARRRPVPDCTGQRVTILMPAHDEAEILGDILDRLAPEIDGWATVVVIADNCVDETADVGRLRGATVVERSDPTRRGKGFALDHGRNYLRSDPPEVVIVLDADCTSDRASLRALAASAVTWNRPCQAINLIKPLVGSPPLVELSNFAFMIKNLVRQRGLQRLTGRTRLVGTGMAFPWPIFDRAPLATDNIVEDVELGLALDRAGTPPQLVTDARNWSDPSSTSGTLIQRTRWEGGFLALAKAKAPLAIGHAVRRLDPRALIAALDLCVPPLTLLAITDGAVLVLAAAATLMLATAWWPVLLFLATLIAAIVLVAIAWAREGRQFIRARTLARIPLYVLWKIPLYLGLARRGAGDWARPGR